MARAPGLIRDDKGVALCWWATSDPDYLLYHDREWGFPVIDDVRLFEKVCLEGFLFLGRAGGFFGDWHSMMGEVVGVRWVPIEVQRDGRKRIVRIDGVLEIDAEAIAGSNEGENAMLVNPPFWKGAPFPAKLGRSKRFTYRDFDLGWEGAGKACRRHDRRLLQGSTAFEQGRHSIAGFFSSNSKMPNASSVRT